MLVPIWDQHKILMKHYIVQKSNPLPVCSLPSCRSCPCRCLWDLTDGTAVVGAGVTHLPAGLAAGGSEAL